MFPPFPRARGFRDRLLPFSRERMRFSDVLEFLFGGVERRLPVVQKHREVLLPGWISAN